MVDNKKKEAIEKLSKVMSPCPSDWREEAEYRRENREWLRISGLVALSVIRKYDNNRKKIQEALGYEDEIRVDDILRGKADLTLSEIHSLIGFEELVRIINKTQQREQNKNIKQ